MADTDAPDLVDGRQDPARRTRELCIRRVGRRHGNIAAGATSTSSDRVRHDRIVTSLHPGTRAAARLESDAVGLEAVKGVGGNAERVVFKLHAREALLVQLAARHAI